MKHIIILLSWIGTCILCTLCRELKRDNRRLQQDDIVFDILMPSVQVLSSNKFLCIAVKIDTDEAFITQFEPHSKASRAHRMILFASSTPFQNMFPQYWDCSQASFGSMKFLFAWAKNAPPVQIPEDVGFRVGQSTDTRYIVLQVHYTVPIIGTVSDNSGFRLLMRKNRPKYTAGIFQMVGQTPVIPPSLPRVNIDVSCNPGMRQPIFVFAYRVHTHELGYAVSGYKFNTHNFSWDQMLKGNPKWPQAFYPVESISEVTQDDVLVARCSYNSSKRHEPTQLGRGVKNEMCNLYLMYYMEEGSTSHASAPPEDCKGNLFPRVVSHLPKGSDDPLPSNPALEDQAVGNEVPQTVSLLTPQEINIIKKGQSQLLPDDNLISNYDVPVAPVYDDNYQYKEAVGWPAANITLGQVTAVSIDNQGNVVIFHRGSHVWNGLSFDYEDRYNLQDEGPIPEDTILVLEPSTGRVLHKWGSNIFYMPHGLTIDAKGFAWLTDVALHQVLKFPENGSSRPDLILGQRFQPGQDAYQFCKPTSVAIAASGDFYVADGYCNSRILKYSSEGKYITHWGHENPIFIGNPVAPPPGAFLIPHKVILANEEKLVCVADRENGRIQCFARIDHSFAFAIQKEEFHGKLFSVAATPDKDGLLYAVCGRSPTGFNHSVQAFVFNLTTRALLNVVTPRQGTFAQPHDLAVSPDSEAMYVGEIGPNIIWKFRRAIHKSGKKVLPLGQGASAQPQVEDSSSQEVQVPSGTLPASPVPQVPTKGSGIAAGSSPAATGDISSNQEASKSKEEKKASPSGVVTEASNFATSMVIMALLGIPILLLVLITVIVRLRKRGRFQQCSLPQVKGWLGGYRTPHGSHEKFNIGSLLNPHKGFDRVALDESDLEVEDKSDSDVEEFNAAATRKA